MPTTIEPGVIIDGKYRVLRRIGEGGMGTVYEGENIRIERRVAIKILHEHVASSPEFAQRFEREARASARIGSQHVCDVLDLGDLPNGERFIVMEFLDGESLEDRLERGTMTADQLAPIAFQILEGLGTMHQAGVIHRDLKPANIFLTRVPRKGEVVKILDFGVAKIVPRADQPNEMTSTGMMMGTPLYMSPEQARGARDVDGRTDIYAASVIFYRALTGEMPHVGVNLHELLFKIVLEEPRPIRDIVPEVDEDFAAIVTKGLARDADHRYTSAREYQEELANWGKAKGNPNLVFAVTLSNEPPPLRSLSGGYPAALIKAQTPVSGPGLRGERVGPPTPQVSTTQSATAMATPTAKQNSGTPTAWSEDAPEIAKRSFAALQAVRAADARPITAGNTQVIDSRRAPSSHVENMAPHTPPPAPVPLAPPGKSRLGLGIGVGLLVVAAVAVGVRFASTARTPAAANASTGSGSLSAAPVVVPEPSPIGSPEPSPIPVATAAEPPTTASASASAPARASSPTIAPHPTGRATATKAVTPAPSASIAKTVAASASTPASPTPSSSGHRKFRTNLE
ncbi:MAG TPA: protein kinase [Labilithrix sp.]|nr:protein kinase [Labilithrix sp.]